jgi:hypothetical protein
LGSTTTAPKSSSTRLKSRGTCARQNKPHRKTENMHILFFFFVLSIRRKRGNLEVAGTVPDGVGELVGRDLVPVQALHLGLCGGSAQVCRVIHEWHRERERERT